jgi:hypothetical protein
MPHHSQVLERLVDSFAAVSEAARTFTPCQMAATPPAANVPPMRTRPGTPRVPSSWAEGVDAAARLRLPTSGIVSDESAARIHTWQRD